jgi:hypothetical protein
MPNWWILIADGQEEDFLAAATATTTALLQVFGVGADELAGAVRLPAAPPTSAPSRPSRPTSGEGEPLVFAGSLGEVRLYPNGVATLDGEPWADEPVREWAVNSEGQIGITLAPAGDKTFPHVGIVENTDQAASVLRRFTPSLDERQTLAHRLAVAEYYPLTCIVTGTIYHYDLGHAVWNLENQYPDYPPRAITGWPFRERLEAATEAASGLWMTQSADNNQQLRSDEQATWEAIQRWLRISPWRDDFDFELRPAERIPFHVAPGPELEIRRVPGARLAQSLAAMAHAGQVDKAGLPYLDHPRRVAERVAQVDGRPAAIAVAWLHDVVEDTTTTLDDLRAAGFDENVVNAVEALTRRSDEGDAYYWRVAANDLAKVVKLADVHDNTDPERVARLDPTDRARLQEKYRHAVEVIADATPPFEPWTLVVRDLEVNDVHSSLTVRREADGCVRFEAQDLGVPAGLVSDHTEYEYVRIIRPRYYPQLIDLLGGQLGDNLRDLLGTRWADTASFELEKLLSGAPFPIEFSSR